MSLFVRQPGKADLAHHRLSTEQQRANFQHVVDTCTARLAPLYPDPADLHCALHVAYHIYYCATPYAEHMPSYAREVANALYPG